MRSDCVVCYFLARNQELILNFFFPQRVNVPGDPNSDIEYVVFRRVLVKERIHWILCNSRARFYDVNEFEKINQPNFRESTMNYVQRSLFNYKCLIISS